MLRHNLEAEFEGIGSPHNEIVYHVSPKEEMPLGEFIAEAGDIVLSIEGQQISLNELYGKDILIGMLHEAGADLTKLVSPLQSMVFSVVLPDVLNPDLPYVELNIDE